MLNPWNDGGPGSNSSRPSSQTAHFLGTMSNTSFGSPTMGATANDSQEVQQFAPNFLFGNQMPTNRRSFATPTRHIIPGYNSPGILKSREAGSGGNKSVHWSPVLVRDRSKSPEEQKRLQRLATVGKSASSTLWNGPPLRSLNEDIVGPPEKQSRLEQPEPLTVTSASFPSRQSELRSNEVEVIELDDERNEGADEDHTYWVTVFGFQPDQREDILELFSRHGDIMAQKSPKQGNWMHIRYSSPVHARQALAKNSSIFCGQMIGVAPCKDVESLNYHETVQNTIKAPVPSAVTNKSSLNGSSLLGRDDSLLLNGSRLIPSTSAYKTHNASLPSRARLSISSRAGMRPLNSSYVSTDGEHNQSMNTSLQQKSNGGDDSFIGKIWSMFTSTGGANTS